MTTTSKPSQSTAGSSHTAGVASPSARASSRSSASSAANCAQVASATVSSGGLRIAVERGDRGLARVGDREDLIEPGDLERLGDVRVAVDDRHDAVLGPQALERTDEHAEGGRVQERRLGEIDDDPGPAGVDRADDRALELRGGEQVDLAADRHDVALGVDVLLRQ